MLEIFERHPYLAAAIVATVLFSIVLQIIIGNMLGRMINEAENIASTENKQLKQFSYPYSVSNKNY